MKTSFSSAKPPDHVAVQRRVADGHLRLVPGRDDEPAELVRQRHQQRPADAGLEVLLGQVRLAAGERAGERLPESADDPLDRDLAEVDAEVDAHLAGVVARALRRVARRHRHRVHAVGAERVGADRCGQRRVDAAGDPEHDVAEAALLDVVADAEAEREAHLLELRRERDDDGLDGLPCGRTATGASITVAGGRALAGALELAPADVAQPPPDRLGRVEIDDEQALLEAGRAGDHLALVVEHDGVAVEDELVLAADEVAEGEVRGVVARPGDEHLLAILGLADVERRGGEVDDQLRAREREVGGRRARLPDVLADRRADEHVAAAEQDELPARRRSSGARRRRRSSAGTACGRSRAARRPRARRRRSRGRARRAGSRRGR